MKKILVPTDFSGTSRNAEDYAVSLAKVLNAEVQLLHVYRDILPATVGPEPWTVTVSETGVENEKLINKEIAYLKAKHGVAVKADVESGSKVKTISAVAKTNDADLIVMGLRGGKRNRILGSTVLNTIRKSKLPVLVVSKEAKFVSIKSILLAVDFSEMLSSPCFDVLFELFRKSDASLRVLHVENPGAGLKASEVPEKLQLGLALHRFNYQYDKVESHDVEEAIQNFMERHPVDLLVLIAHHHTIYERIFETIHTRAISFKIKQPLLILQGRS